jgi:uncharacterized membrane protein YphA (DoxX/SURF4 family)
MPKRVAFRFGVLAGALYVYPFPIGYIPKTEPIASLLGKPWEWLVVWFAESILALDRPPIQLTGSGDTAFAWLSTLLILILAAIGAALWTAIDQGRSAGPSPAHPRLASASIIVLRYVLAFTMFRYGFAKIIPLQFSTPTAAQLDGRIGDMSPMGLLWTFMDYSATYTVFAGIAEAIGGVLLLWRRTATLGAFVVMVVMTNVVMLNFCYDVPVKLYSVQLLVMAATIAMPHVRRVLAAVLGYAAAAVVDRPRATGRRELARRIAKGLMLACAAISIVLQLQQSLEWRGHSNGLEGIWVVETWSADGVEKPPLTTDGERWRKLAIAPRYFSIRLMSDETMQAGLEVDPAARTIAVKSRDPATWRYLRRDADHLVIDGKWGGKQVHATLVREPAGLLMSRDFNWVQEFPFNR